MAKKLRAAGLDGVEIAPTVIWPSAPQVRSDEVSIYASYWRNNGLNISGIQSLLFGHPEFQVFDQSTWPSMTEHISAMIRLAQSLGTHIAVFGSPKNRVRGVLGKQEANAIFADFLGLVIPILAECNVVLAIEPNAPEYGADYLTRYTDTVALTDLVASPWVQPQIDTGCLNMVGEDPAAAVLAHTPAHIHVSAPNLSPLPGPVNHDALQSALASRDYSGWVALEMLATGPDPVKTAIRAAFWLAQTYTSGPI